MKLQLMFSFSKTKQMKNHNHHKPQNLMVTIQALTSVQVIQANNSRLIINRSAVTRQI